MTISIKPDEALRQLNALDVLLQSYNLSEGDDLIEKIRPFWKGTKADEVKQKYAILREQLSNNIEQAKKFCEQGRETVGDFTVVDNQ